MNRQSALFAALALAGLLAASGCEYVDEDEVEEMNEEVEEQQQNQDEDMQNQEDDGLDDSGSQ